MNPQSITSLAHQPTAFPSPRRGSAIIVVVGLLAILFIMAVAFTEMMRVERGASANYRHNVGARQMLHVGLAQALAAIDSDPTNGGVGDLAYPPWTNRTIAVSSRQVVLQQELLQSMDPNVGDPNSISKARILSAEVVKYIPRNLLPSIQSKNTSKPEWIPQYDKDHTSLIGRYAYLVVNSSGLLDANEVAKTNRWMGASPGEITFSNNCPSDLTNAFNFVDSRSNDVSYETLKDLAENNDGLNTNTLSNFETFSFAPSNDELADRAPDYTAGSPQYKLYIGGDLESRVTNNTTAVSYYPTLAPTIGSVSNRLVAILSRPDMLGYTMQATSEGAQQIPNRVDRFMRSLFDYISTNPAPRSFCYPRTKYVPLIRCIAWAPAITYTTNSSQQGQFACSNAFYFYAYWPNKTVLPGTNYAYVTVQNTQAPSPNTYLGEVLFPNTPVTFVMKLTNYVAGNSERWLGAQYFTNCTSAWHPALGNLTNGNYYMCRFKIAITNSIYGGVEQVPGDWSQLGIPIQVDKNDLTNPVPIVANHAVWSLTNSWQNPVRVGPLIRSPICKDPSGYYWAETVDPRFNWNPSLSFGGLTEWFNDYNQRQYIGILPGFSVAINISDPWSSFPTQLMQHPDWIGAASANKIQLIFDGVGNHSNTTTGVSTPWNDSLDDQKNMYVAKRPLQSLGELGFIPICYFFTSRLASQNDANESTSSMVPACGYHRMLDYFTLTPPTNSSSRHGLVNINTRNADVITAVLLNMPRREWSPAAPFNLTVAQAANISTQLLSYIQAGGCISNLTDAGSIPFWNNALANSAAMNATCKFDREAFIRNVGGMLTTRQQFYTIIVRADSLASRFGYNDLSHSSVLGSSLAVFQVWRDPVADSNNGGKHRCFVRLCKVINQ